MEERNNTIRLITFNILVDRRTDMPYSWEYRRNQIAALLEYYNPDIFCLQEALEHQKNYLAECFPEYECFGVGRNDGKIDGEQVPIFHRKNMFKLKAQGYFWLSETPHISASIGWDAKCPRIVVWKQLQHKAMEEPFTIVNTHYDHKGKIANKNSAKIIKQELSSIDPRCATLLCGDFNSSEQTPAYNEILSCGFTDSSTVKEAVCYGMPFTYHRFLMEQYKTDLLSIQQEHDRVFRAIDHIFHCGEIKILRYGILGDNQLGIYPSDHFPILCDITFIDKL
jgi:endonuclease/exonuclease/phosphatase family metal-dependent hydrolase